MMKLGKTLEMMSKVNRMIIIFAAAIFLVGSTVALVHAQEHDATPVSSVPVAAPTNLNPGLGYIAIALATGLSAIAAGIAVSNVGAAAIGSITEKPELFGRALIFVGLAEGIAIYGLIVSIILLTKI